MLTGVGEGGRVFALEEDFGGEAIGKLDAGGVFGVTFGLSVLFGENASGMGVGFMTDDVDQVVEIVCGPFSVGVEGMEVCVEEGSDLGWVDPVAEGTDDGGEVG